MYTLHQGRLAEKPKIVEREFGGEKIKVVNTTIYFYDPTAEKDEKGLQHGTPCPIVAWEENAEILASKHKGDMITFIGPSRTLLTQVIVKENEKNKYVTVPALGYLVRKIDDTDAWANDMNELLKAIVKGTINNIPKV